MSGRGWESGSVSSCPFYEWQARILNDRHLPVSGCQQRPPASCPIEPHAKAILGPRCQQSRVPLVFHFYVVVEPLSVFSQARDISLHLSLDHPRDRPRNVSEWVLHLFKMAILWFVLSLAFGGIPWHSLAGHISPKTFRSYFLSVFCFCSIKSLHHQHQLCHQKHHQRMEPQFLQEHKDAFDVSTFEVWSVWCLDWMFYANDPSPTKQLLDMLCRLMILHRKTNRITVNKSRHVTWAYNYFVIDLFRNPFHLHPLIALTVSHDLMFPSCSSSSYKFTNRAVQNWWMTRENNSKYCIAFWLFLPD